MRLNPKEILEKVRVEGFERVWARSADLMPKGERRLELEGKGRSHPLQDLIQRMRQALLDLGFDEVVIPIIVEEREIYKQYGPEAPVILDRCYYLATLPRPDIGLRNEKCEKIRELGISLDEDRKDHLQRVLRDYKRGKIDSDDLVEKISEALKTTDDAAIHVIREVFPEFETLKPIPSTLTLRSHMTSSWFETIKVVQHRRTLPIKLFSIGVRFRREQSEDATHLRAHHGASCIVMNEEVTAEDGKNIAEKVLNTFNLGQLKFVKKKVSSKYYTPGTEYEGFIYLPSKNDWVEVVDLGLYSPIALAHYNIEYPVLNLGIGVERIGMILYEEADIRKLVYPQFYAEWSLSDEELARMVKVSIEPKTLVGQKIREAIVKTATAEAEKPSPCECLAYEGEVFGRKVNISVYEKDEDTKLLGPAAFNTICVYNGDVLGIPAKGMDHVKGVKEARAKGIMTRITFLEAIAALAAAKIEEAAKNGRPNEVDVRVRLAKLPSDVNIGVDEVAQHYITSRRKRIVVKGPVFVGIKARIVE